MLPMLNARQIKLLSDAAAGTPEPATAQGLREHAQLRTLGLLDFGGSGRYEVTPQGRARLASYALTHQRSPASIH